MTGVTPYLKSLKVMSSAIYKHLPNAELAKKVNDGVFRFYDLTKYKKMEDKHGRLDNNEGGIGFKEEEYNDSIQKLPQASLITKDGTRVNFSLSNFAFDDSYLSQYFVLCTSKDKSENIIGDSQYIVELNTDVFDFFEKLFLPPEGLIINDGRKMFSHGDVEYYDINNHPRNIENERWREVFFKHSEFEYQNEYRAALFVSDTYFNRIKQGVEKKLLNISLNGERMDFTVEIILRSGIDEHGWRYIEIDVSDLQQKLIKHKAE